MTESKKLTFAGNAVRDKLGEWGFCHDDYSDACVNDIAAAAIESHEATHATTQNILNEAQNILNEAQNILNEARRVSREKSGELLAAREANTLLTASLRKADEENERLTRRVAELEVKLEGAESLALEMGERMP